MLFQRSQFERSSYIPLPKQLRNSVNRMSNIQNEDTECFRWCLETLIKKSVKTNVNR